jgi:hypothetical protein
MRGCSPSTDDRATAAVDAHERGQAGCRLDGAARVPLPLVREHAAFKIPDQRQRAAELLATVS